MSSKILCEMTEKEGGIVKKSHDESMKLAMDIYSEFGFSLGMLPLKDMKEAGFVRSTGYVWVSLERKGGTYLHYDTEITGYIEKRRMKKMKGVKCKELMLWVAVDVIVIDDPTLGKIHCKGSVGLTKTFPVEAFAVGQ